ncbi:MAG: LLM class flavin-dependent oxidoreductase [Steroidobacteraceae bacterium]
MAKPPLVSIPLSSDRNLPPPVFAQSARAAAASKVVDNILVWDQHAFFVPPQLWNTKTTPMAAVLPDVDSFSDAFALAAYGGAAAPELGLMVSTDAVRRGPAEVMQSALTLSAIGGREAVIMMGAGEVKQTKPFGWDRSQGLARLEDHLKLFHALWDSQDKPLNFDGNVWNMRNAWIGKARGKRPQIWALGGGPKLLDMATSYADGFSTVVPNNAATPEAWNKLVTSMKQALERKGRDPEAFHFDIWLVSLVHDDRAVLDRALDNPIMRWMAACWGRLNQREWAAEGVEPAFPLDWHYAMKLLPQEFTDAQIADVLSKTSRKMAEKTYFHGDAKTIAGIGKSFVDAGATSVTVSDTLALVLDPQDAQNALARSLEVCRILKRG